MDQILLGVLLQAGGTGAASELVPAGWTLASVTSNTAGLLGTAFIGGLFLLGLAFRFIGRTLGTAKKAAR